MEFSRFTEILKEASGSDDPIEAIKQKLEKEYPKTYKEWENDNFNINHIFITKSGFGTLLGMAYIKNHPNLVNALRKKGAHIRDITNWPESTIHYRIKNNNVELLNRMLTEKCYNASFCNAVNQYGETSLHLLVKENSEGIDRQ